MGDRSEEDEEEYKRGREGRGIGEQEGEDCKGGKNGKGKERRWEE